MIFPVGRPITADDVRRVCVRFNEGLRIEYKANLDPNVREQLPKIVSSFANSNGGTLVVGVNATNGVPQEPFDGFTPSPREELPLTVENICLSNINPALLPRTHVVQSQAQGRIFLVIEVDDSSEAPHAIENSKKVYVRTGNAANPYDLADVDLIIDLLKRRHEPLERRNRLLAAAQTRSYQTVPRDPRPFLQASVCPSFPRAPLCSSQEVWDFMQASQHRLAMTLAHQNFIRRIPDGAASLTRPTADLPRLPDQYFEIGKYGLLYAARRFHVTEWNPPTDMHPQLYFADLFQTLVRLTGTAKGFYSARGYQGSLLMNASLHHVQGSPMRFVASGIFGDNPQDYLCYTDEVLAERFVTTTQVDMQTVDLLVDILGDLTWAFWQANEPLPVAALRASVQQMVHQMGG